MLRMTLGSMFRRIHGGRTRKNMDHFLRLLAIDALYRIVDCRGSLFRHDSGSDSVWRDWCGKSTSNTSDKEQTILWLLVIAGFSTIHTVLISQPRYRLVLEPILWMLAISGGATLLQLIPARALRTVVSRPH